MSEDDRDERRASDQGDPDAQFIASVAGPMREAESLDATFEERLLAAIQAEVDTRNAQSQHDPSRSWWRKGRNVTLSPLKALAIAAGIVAIFVGGAATAELTGRVERVSAADTVHVVRFVFVDSAARSVALVGDFNGWAKGATPLTPAGRRGTWIVSIPLTLGRHEYAFIVDGQRWVADPFAATMYDDFGTESSIVTLGGTQS